MSRFQVVQAPIAGLAILERSTMADSRGSLSRIFCGKELEPAGWTGAIAQINHTLTRQVGTVRGMHYQHPPNAETKVVSCLRGAVWDVAVDIRKGSSTFLKWHAERLSAENQRALLIPKGFAHGFQCLEPDSELIYLHSDYFAPANEGGLAPLDPVLSISWPLPVADMSSRDLSHPMITKDFAGLIL